MKSNPPLNFLSVGGLIGGPYFEISVQLNGYELVVFFVRVGLDQVYGSGYSQVEPIFENDGLGDLKIDTEGGADQYLGLQPKEGVLRTDGEDFCVFFEISASNIAAGHQSRKRELERPLSLRDFGSALDGGFMW